MTTTRKILLAAIFGAGLVTTSAPLLAQNAGFYLGGSLGQSKAKDACDGITSCDDTDTAWKLFGGYRLNRYFSAELGYTDLGKFSGTGIVSGVNINASFKANAWELVGIGSIPFGRISPYGKLGLYRGEVKGRAVGTLGAVSATATGKDTNTDLTFGVGARFDFTNNIGLRGEWQRYQKMGGDNVGESDVDVLSVGLMYHF